MEKLVELLYTSKISPEQSPACVANILRVSRNNNAAQQITGLLIFDGQWFCQYLEGPQITVTNLIEKIRRDPRHILFDIKAHGTLKQPRRFAEWSMRYALAYNESAIAGFNEPNLDAPVALLETLLPSLSF